MRRGQKLLRCGLAAECSTFIHSVQKKNGAFAEVIWVVLNYGAVSPYACVTLSQQRLLKL